MKPSELASALRRIAFKIDQSKNPDRNLVARDLKKVLASINTYQVWSHLHDPSGAWGDVKFVQHRLNHFRKMISGLIKNGFKIVGYGEDEDFYVVVVPPSGVDAETLLDSISYDGNEFDPGQPHTNCNMSWPEGEDPAKIAWDNYLKMNYEDEGESLLPYLDIK